MHIDVNAVADRLHLTRTQLTAARSGQLNPKATVLTDGRALTEVASARGEQISDIRSKPLVTPKPPTVVPRAHNFQSTSLVTPKPPTVLSLTHTVQPDRPGTTSPTLRGIAEPTVDLKSSAQTLTKSGVASDLGPAEPVGPLDALLADWGQSDSPHDLDGNGIVGVSDLLMLLASLTEGPQQVPAPPHGDVRGRPSTEALPEPRLSDTSPPERPPTNDLDALLADWGQSDSPYDFDGNGIVGVSDLLMLLASLTEGPQQVPSPPLGDVRGRRGSSASAPHVLAKSPAQPNTPHDPPIAPGKRVAIGVNATTIAQHVIDQLDKNNSGAIAPPQVDGSTPKFDRLDRNHDGALSRSELAAQIRDMLLDHIAMSPNTKLDQFVREAMTRLLDHDDRTGAPGERGAAIQRSSRVYQQANLEATARQLVQRLTDQGATELRKLVQEGELSANEKRAVLDQISILRPGAQSVNMVG